VHSKYNKYWMADDDGLVCLLLEKEGDDGEGRGPNHRLRCSSLFGFFSADVRGIKLAKKLFL